MEPYYWAAFGSAWLHAISFAIAKLLWRHSDNPLEIMVLGQLFCAMICLPALIWLDVGVSLRSEPLALLTLCILIVLAQLSFTQSMRVGDASFVTPMMGMKVLIVAVISAFWLGETYATPVYLGAIGTIASLFLLTDGRPPASIKPLLWVLLTCGLFAIIDVTMVRLMLDGMPSAHLALIVMVGPSVLLLPVVVCKLPRQRAPDWLFSRDLFLFAITQVAGVALLVIAFGLAEKATLVNILQTSRGLWVLAVVFVIGRLGLVGMEQLHGRQYIWRASGASLMMASLALVIVSSNP